MRITVFQQTVSDEANVEKVLVVLFFHSCVNIPAYHLHFTLGPVLNIVPGERKEMEVRREPIGG